MKTQRKPKWVIDKSWKNPYKFIFYFESASGNIQMISHKEYSRKSDAIRAIKRIKKIAFISEIVDNT